MSKNYVVVIEQQRSKKIEVPAANKREARERALDLLGDGALDDGFVMPPGFGFKTKVVLVAPRVR